MVQSPTDLVRANARRRQFLAAAMAASGLAAAFGCGSSGVSPASAPREITIAGSVTAGQKPILGSQVQLHVLVPSSAGSGPAPVFNTTSSTDADGAFQLKEVIACPSSDSVVYLAASGGRAAAYATTNSAISLVTVLGSCATLSSRADVVINETTTVGALWPLSPYMLPPTSTTSSQALSQAVATASKLVNLANGSTPGTLSPNEIAPVEKVNTLGSILASCINSAGGSAGDGTSCGNLFASVLPLNLSAPQDTLTAALQIARNPSWNVEGIFNLFLSQQAVQPYLATAPSDWTLPITTQPTAPVLSPSGGKLNPGQSIAITDEIPDVDVYYTLDGSLPTSSSNHYAGPISISSSTTVTAVAIKQNAQSAFAAAAFTVALPITIALTPPVVTLSPSQSQIFQANVTGTSQTSVTYSFQPALGTISATGLYTAPASVNGTASVTLTAQTTDGSAKTAQATIKIVPNSLQLSVPNTFFTAGSSLVAEVTLSQPAPQGGSIVTLTGSNPAVAGVSPATITIPAGQTQASFTITGIQPGQVTLTASSPGYGSSNGTLAVNAPAVTAQFMGLNVGDTVHRFPSFQFGTLLTNNRIQWAQTNSNPGSYDFSILDQFFQFARTYNADIVFPLLDTPAWASSNPTENCKDGPGLCAPPANMVYWDNYVRAVATYAGTQVKYWTVGNEVQDPGYWSGDVPTLVIMVQHAREIIRSINPGAIIVAPTTTDINLGPKMLAKFLAAGGGQYVDVIAFHGYVDSTAEDVLPMIAAYKQVLTAAGVNLPLWDTEADWAGEGGGSITDPSAQGAFVAKYYLLHWSQNVARFVWYEYDGGPWGGLVDDSQNYKETLAATAYAETYKWMVGASMNEPCASGSNGTWSCGLVRPGGYAATVMWNSNQNVLITVPSGTTLYRDLTGVEHPVAAGSSLTVGNQPILLENASLPH